MTRDDFLQQAVAAAAASSAISGFSPGITVAQAALESAWGQSRLSRVANNYFGIKALARYDRIAMPTFEVEGGVRKAVTAWFARFPSMTECFLARDRLIATGVLFAEARAAKADAEQFTQALAGTGQPTRPTPTRSWRSTGASSCNPSFQQARLRRRFQFHKEIK